MRATYILLVICAALASYYFLVERKKPNEAELQKQQRAVFALDREKIRTLEVAFEGAELRCEKDEKGWRMVRPVQDMADETAVAGLLSEASKLEASRFLPPDAGALTDFGLDDPDIRVSMTAETPADSHWILVGDATPTNDAYYSFVDRRDRIALIPCSTVDSNFKKKPFDLRKKTVLDFKVADVTALEIVYDKVKLRCERLADGPWTITEPRRAKGDNAAINSILWDLENAKARGFVDDVAEDISAYGLKDPAATVNVFIGAGRSLMKMDFGTESDEAGTVYAYRTRHTNVAKVDRTLLEKVKTQFDDLREKRLFDFATSDVAAMEAAVGDTIFSCVRDSAGEWTAVFPESTALKKWKMNGISSQISFLRAFSFVDNEKPNLERMGLLEPQVRVSVKLLNFRTALLELGAIDGDELHVRADGQIAKVSANLLKDIAALVRQPPYAGEETRDQQP